MICPNCQSENKEGAKFCNDCGFPLTGRIATVAAAAAGVKADHDEDAAKAPSGVSDELARIGSEQEASVDEKPARNGDLKATVPPLNAEEEPEDRAQNSGPLDPSKLPVIGIAGVDVDENGNEFDFDAVDADFAEEEQADESADRAERQEAPKAEAPLSAAVTADLSGLDECLVDASYVPPQSAWKSGGTMEMPRIEDAPAPKQKEFRAPDPNEKKHGKGRVVAIVVALLLVAAAAVVGVSYQMELWGGKIIPDVAGMTQADATYVLESKGFSVRATQVKSDETEGIVLLMDPAAGSRSENGTEIVIHVAVGRVVPDIVGKKKDEAAKLLAEEGFDHVTYTETKSNEAEGTVLAVTPDAGTKALGSSNVSVSVAKPYTVPDITGLTYDQAVAALNADTYIVRDSYAYDENLKPGTIMGTDPAAGSKLESGAMVSLIMSKSRASELVSAAQAYLSSAGSVTIGGTSYQIISVDGVSYLGNNQTAFTITGAAVTTLDGETVRGSAKQKSGTITWDDANQIVSIA